MMVFMPTICCATQRCQQWGPCRPHCFPKHSSACWLNCSPRIFPRFSLPQLRTVKPSVRLRFHCFGDDSDMWSSNVMDAIPTPNPTKKHPRIIMVYYEWPCGTCVWKILSKVDWRWSLVHEVNCSRSGATGCVAMELSKVRITSVTKQK